MPDYAIFGGTLRSALEFPELVAVRGPTPDWTLRVSGLPPDDEHVDVLHDATLSASCRVRVTRHAGRHRFIHSCTGTFEISPDGRDICFAPGPGARLDVARTDLIARVLLLAAHRPGVAWMHGSAVVCGGRAIAFLGNSGVGKSSLALALTRAGAKHVCDDTLPIELGTPPVVWPSDHTLRLNDDTKDRFARGVDAVRREADGKFILTHDMIAHDATPDDGLARGVRAPLEAIYLVVPETNPTVLSRAVARTRLSSSASVPALIPQVKVGPVLPRGSAARVLNDLAAIVDTVPVYQLRIARDWSMVERVVAQLLQWHPPTAATPCGETVLADAS
jgi:hypothetical protein